MHLAKGMLDRAAVEANRAIANIESQAGAATLAKINDSLR